MNNFLTKAGYTRSVADPCLYIRMIGSKKSYLMVYVDDIVLASNFPKEVERIKAMLKKRYRISDLGEVNHLLGMKVSRDWIDKTIDLSQGQFTKTVLETFQRDSTKGTNLPADPSEHLHSSQCSDDVDDPVVIKRRTLYSSMVGCFMWLVQWTRPDIAFVVNRLARFLHKPGIAHLNAAFRLLGYLLRTQKYSLTLGGGGNTLTAYCDSDFCSDREKGLSVSGYVLKIGNTPIIWKSKLLKAVCCSTSEAEYLALKNMGRDVVWLRRLLSELGFLEDHPTVVFEDNKPCIDWCNSDSMHKATRHIHVSYHYIKELIREKLVTMQHISSEFQLADIFTKALPKTLFDNHFKNLNLNSH